MTNFADLSDRMEAALQLPTAPVAVTFLDTMPADSNPPDAPVPAGCSFWHIGAHESIVTSAEHHQFCSIGVHTHNLADAPVSQRSELETALGAMQGLDYVRPGEVAALPTMPTASRHVAYSPLRDAETDPSVVLVFTNASQGLIMSEAIARVDDATPVVMGRPACALIPQVINSGHSASSLGCCGARAYLDGFTDGVAMWALSGVRLQAYVDEIETLANANSVLTQFHSTRRAAIESGESPTVAQSLQALA